MSSILSFFCDYGPGGYGEGHGWGMGYGMGYGGWIPMILFWLLIIVVVVAIFRFSTSRANIQHPGAGGGESAMEILKKRYARGEISKEQYDEMRKDVER